MSQVPQDWKERDFAESVECGIRKCVDFLNNFHESAKYRLSVVDARLSTLERKLDFLEASLEHCDPGKRQAKAAPFKGSIFDPEVRRKVISQSEQMRIQNRRKFNNLVIAPKKEKKGKPIQKMQTQRQPTQNASKQQTQQRRQQRPTQQKPATQPQSRPQAQPKPQPKPQPKQQPKFEPKPVVQQQPPAVPPNAAVQKPPAVPQNAQQPPPIPKPQQPPNPVQQQPPPAPGAGPPPNPMAQQPPPNPVVAQKPPPNPVAAPKQPPAAPKVEQKPPAVPGPPGPPGPPAGPGAAAMGPGAAAPRPPPGPGAPANPAPKKWPNTEGNQIDIKMVKEGAGAIPGGQSAVEIEYTGHLFGVDVEKHGPSGKQFIKHREVIQLGKKMNIKGLEQAVTRIKVGSQIQLWIPSRLAYGARGAGAMIPPNSDLLFNLMLHRIVKQ